MELREQLESMTTSGYGMDLSQYVKISGVKTASKRKADMVDALYNYLSNKDNIIAIWNSISQMEKEIISEYIRSEGKLERKEVKEIMKKYNPNETNSGRYVYESGIIIQPNYEIIVQSGTMKDVHCIYLDKFAEKLSEDTASIYKISFKAMVTALDNEISIEEIIDYFEEFSQNKIPDNVLLSLNEWKEKSKKIKIRRVTIVETDDKYLLEELKNYKEIKKDTLSELPYAFEIDSKAANKVKRNIEKKNHFCIIE